MKAIFSHSRLLALALILFAACLNASAFAQSPWHVLFPAKTASPASKNTGIQADYPQHCTNFLWNSGGSAWDTTGQTTFTYNNNGGLLERLSSVFNTGQFTNDSRETHFYNQEGFDSVTLAEIWNGAAWLPNYRFLRTFDPFGNIASSIGEAWNGNDWDTSSGYRAFFTYHNTQQIASVIQETYRVGIGWDPSYKMDYTFDSQNRWDTVTGYLHDQGVWNPDLRLLDIAWRDFERSLPDSGRFENNTTGIWENYQRYRVTYSQYDSQVWIYDKFAVSWDSSEKYIFNFNQEGDEVLSEAYRWLGSWVQTDGLATHYLYGTAGEKMEVWQERFDGSGYVNDNRQVYADFFTEAAPATVKTLSVRAFPNPVMAADRLEFQLSLDRPGPVRVKLYDLQGQLRAETVTHSAGLLTFPLSAFLENGTYLYRVETFGGTATGKVILSR